MPCRLGAISRVRDAAQTLRRLRCRLDHLGGIEREGQPADGLHGGLGRAGGFAIAGDERLEIPNFHEPAPAHQLTAENPLLDEADDALATLASAQRRFRSRNKA